MVQLCDIIKNIIFRCRSILVFITEVALNLIFGIRDADSGWRTTFMNKCIPLNYPGIFQQSILSNINYIANKSNQQYARS